MADVTIEVSEDQIGGWYNSAGQWKSWLSANDGSNITFKGSNWGGSILDGFVIQNAIGEHKGTTTFDIDGYAASAYTVMSMGADRVIAADNSFYLPHKVSSWVDIWGYLNEDDIDAAIESLEQSKRENVKMDIQIIRAYEKKTGMSQDDLKALMKKDEWMTAQEAETLGFVDEVYDAKERGNKAPDQTASAFSKMVATAKRLNMPKIPFTNGASLGAELDGLIEAKVDDDNTRLDIIAQMATASGLSEETVNEIIAGTTNCPTLERLTAFAGILDTTLQNLQTLAESDGCTFDTEDSANASIMSDTKNAIKKLTAMVKGLAKNVQDIVKGNTDDGGVEDETPEQKAAKEAAATKATADKKVALDKQIADAQKELKALEVSTEDDAEDDGEDSEAITALMGQVKVLTEAVNKAKGTSQPQGDESPEGTPKTGMHKVQGQDEFFASIGAHANTQS